eukprot:TRINITY_DN33538_c0_g2_i1.p1 TRINITY_DN33538_c0_g2~~TRINITY_DN33538_c0_g2_i1.p1  ORF type:complete len:440 (-),score=81.35 TRINITY_DN33538_c0_g2_i1:66-1361(-)
MYVSNKPVVHSMSTWWCEGSFKDVRTSALTLFQSVVVLEGWQPSVWTQCTSSPIAACTFFLAFLIINLGLLNTVAGVIIDRQVQARENDQEYVQVLQEERHSQSLVSVEECRTQRRLEVNGYVTFEELMNTYNEVPAFKEMLTRMDIRKNDLATVYQIIDLDLMGDVTWGEFLMGLNSFKFEDEHTLAILTRFYTRRTFEMMSEAQAMKDTLAEACSRRSLPANHGGGGATTESWDDSHTRSTSRNLVPAASNGTRTTASGASDHVPARLTQRQAAKLAGQARTPCRESRCDAAAACNGNGVKTPSKVSLDIADEPAAKSIPRVLISKDVVDARLQELNLDACTPKACEKVPTQPRLGRHEHDAVRMPLSIILETPANEAPDWGSSLESLAPKLPSSQWHNREGHSLPMQAPIGRTRLPQPAPKSSVRNRE